VKKINCGTRHTPTGTWQSQPRAFYCLFYCLLPCFGHQLDNPIYSLGPNSCAIHACGEMVTLCARAVAGRVALMLLPAYAYVPFVICSLVPKMRART
jgi:hypothetical protein